MRNHQCGKFPCSDESCEHYRSPLEIELTEEVQKLLKAKLPPGARVRFSGGPFWQVRVVCGGSIPIMAYTCCLKPGHEGQCYCEYKSVSFTPEKNDDRPEERPRRRARNRTQA